MKTLTLWVKISSTMRLALSSRNLNDDDVRDLRSVVALTGSSPQIQTVDLSNNCLTRPPVSLLALHSVSFVDLSRNSLATVGSGRLGDRPFPVSIQTLVLTFNHLTAVGDLRYLVHLESLDISYNNLLTLSSSTLPVSIRTLTAQGNAIVSVERLCNQRPALRLLHTLKLQDNNLHSAEELAKLASLPSLRHLHIHHNPISFNGTVRSILSTFPRLSTLDAQPFVHSRQQPPRPGSGMPRAVALSVTQDLPDADTVRHTVHQRHLRLLEERLTVALTDERRQKSQLRQLESLFTRLLQIRDDEVRELERVTTYVQVEVDKVNQTTRAKQELDSTFAEQHMQNVFRRVASEL